MNVAIGQEEHRRLIQQREQQERLTRQQQEAADSESLLYTGVHEAASHHSPYTLSTDHHSHHHGNVMTGTTSFAHIFSMTREQIVQQCGLDANAVYTYLDITDDDFALAFPTDREIERNIMMIAKRIHFADYMAKNDHHFRDELHAILISGLRDEKMIHTVVKRLYVYWNYDLRSVENQTYFDWCHQRFDEGGLKPDSEVTFDFLNTLEMKQNLHVKCITAVYNIVHINDLNYTSSPEIRALHRCILMLNTAYSFLDSFYRSRIINLGRYRDNISITHEMWKQSINGCASTLGERQQLFIYLLETAHNKGYKRYRESCYREIQSQPILIYKPISEWLRIDMNMFGDPTVAAQWHSLCQHVQNNRLPDHILDHFRNQPLLAWYRHPNQKYDLPIVDTMRLSSPIVSIPTRQTSSSDPLHDGGASDASTTFTTVETAIPLEAHQDRPNNEEEEELERPAKRQRTMMSQVTSIGDDPIASTSHHTDSDPAEQSAGASSPLSQNGTNAPPPPPPTTQQVRMPTVADDPWVPISIEHGGNSTRAYQYVSTISNFVYSNVSRYKNFKQWVNLSNGDNASSLIKFLKKTIDPQFEDITTHRTRTVFAFANGLYLAHEGKFIFYRDQHFIPEGVMACKYFPLIFPCKPQPMSEWKTLPTPKFERILRYQNLEEQVIDWIYVLMGRMIYDVGVVDKWQVVLMIKGIAGCGKSTIAKVIQSFYEPCDVGTVASSSEEIFGMQTIYDKYIAIATEVKKRFNFPQDKFQQAVSGERVSVAIKNHEAKDVQWKTQMMFFGNEVPNWVDAQGSIRRRILCVLFDRYVKERDKNPNLDDEILMEELPTLIRKCNEAYLTYAEKYRGKDIWDIVPKYFVRTADKLQSQINPVMSFITNGKYVSLDKNSYVSMNDFREKFAQFCIMENGRRSPLNEDMYSSVFQHFGIAVRTATLAYNGKRRPGVFVFGLRLKKDEDDEEEVEEEMHPVGGEEATRQGEEVDPTTFHDVTTTVHGQMQ